MIPAGGTEWALRDCGAFSFAGGLDAVAADCWSLVPLPAAAGILFTVVREDFGFSAADFVVKVARYSAYTINSAIDAALRITVSAARKIQRGAVRCGRRSVAMLGRLTGMGRRGTFCLRL